MKLRREFVHCTSCDDFVCRKIVKMAIIIIKLTLSDIVDFAMYSRTVTFLDRNIIILFGWRLSFVARSGRLGGLCWRCWRWCWWIVVAVVVVVAMKVVEFVHHAMSLCVGRS